MQISTRDAQLIGLALGTFNVTLLFLVLILPLHLFGELGDLLEDLNSVLGLALFGLLWVVTSYCTYRGVEESGAMQGARTADTLRSSLRWGAINGMAFAAGLIAGFTALSVVVALASLSLGPAVFLLIFGVIALMIGGIVGALVGVALGVIFGMIDLCLLRMSRLLVGEVRHA